MLAANKKQPPMAKGFQTQLGGTTSLQQAGQQPGPLQVGTADSGQQVRYTL